MKTLIISHNPFSIYNNMGKTLCTFFGETEKEHLCQLYIYPVLPDADRCSSSYRITDKDVLRFYFSGKVCGREVTSVCNVQDAGITPADERLYGDSRNKQPLRMLLRDWMWQLAPWFNRDLRAWLEREKPDRIFLAPGDAKFIYRIAQKLSRVYGLPIVAYICDDYYFLNRPKGLLAGLSWRLLQRRIEQLMAQTNHLITICKEIGSLYSVHFSVPATTIMTGSAYGFAEAPRVVSRPKTLTYMGNVRCGRAVPLSEIGHALDALNEEQGTDYQLEIYTGERDEAVLAPLCGIASVRLCGFVSGAAFDEVFYGAQVLVHTEAFDPGSIDRVKYSVSTKIADCLGSGIPLLAYGPSEVASIKHLIDHQCAFIITDRSELKDRLDLLFRNPEQCRQIAEQALKTAKHCHDSLKNGKQVKRIMETCV